MQYHLKYLLCLVVSRKLVCWHIVHCLTLCDLKAAQINLRDLILYKLELGYKAMETIKNICCAKVEGHCWSQYDNQMVQKISLGLQEP